MNKKTAYLIFTVLIVLLAFGLGSLGRFFDISEQPRPVDVIVSLGGGDSFRIKTTYRLYKNGMSKSKKIIITGVDCFDPNIKLHKVDWRVSYLEKEGVKKSDIISIGKAENTMQEVLFVKQYLLEHQMHSVMFVSNPPHSRRISFFASDVAKYQDDNISYIITAADSKWWNRDSFYTNPKAVIYVLSESVKYVYYYMRYGFLG